MRNAVRRFVLLAVLCGALVARSQEPRRTIVADQRYFPALQALLGRAQKRIDILQFSFAIDDGGAGINFAGEPYLVARQLVELKRTKPELVIRLYLEGERDTSARNRLTGEYLASQGIEVQYGATHAKGFAVDDDLLLLGSTNLTVQSLRRNNETNVLLEGHPTVAAGFRRYFDSLWNGTKRPDRPTRKERGVRLLPDGVYKEELLAAFAVATKTIDFSIYYFNDAALERALIAAHSRGVAVRGYVNQHDSFGLDLVERNRATVKRLHDAGVTDVFLDVPDNFSHSKYAIVDGKTVYLGTGNWNPTDVGEHPQLYLAIDDAEMAARLSTHLSSQIAYETPHEATERPYHRFWLGTRRPDLSEEEFDAAIGARFVAATVRTGAGRGLHAYLPVLVAAPGTSLPHEIALVSYDDPRRYRAIRESSAGSVYGPLHFEFFEKSSKSAVPGLFQGTVAFDKAYDISPPETRWVKGDTVFLLSRRRAGATDAIYGDTIAGYLGADVFGGRAIDRPDGHVSYVGKDWYVEYVHFPTKILVTHLRAFLRRREKALGAALETPHHVERLPRLAALHPELRRSAGPVEALSPRRTPGGVNADFLRVERPEVIAARCAEQLSRTPTEEADLRTRIRQAFLAGDLPPEK